MVGGGGGGARGWWGDAAVAAEAAEAVSMAARIALCMVRASAGNSASCAQAGGGSM